jgi:protein-S-isoprenylcysteine O-methyltransferase Ste14
MFVFAYSVGAYVVFALTFLYAIGFVENWVVSQTIDATSITAGHWLAALVVNSILFGLLAMQQTLMARPAYRDLWPRRVPDAVQRSTHVLVSCLMLMFVFLRWRPIPFALWSLEVNLIGLVLELLSFAGWAIAIVGTFQIDHFFLFGLAQGLAHVRGLGAARPDFDVPFLYRWVRHPIYFGLLVAVWCTSVMTVGHLLFAGLFTALVKHLVRLEEDDLVLEHPEYRSYQAHVPRLWPRTSPLQFRRRAG